MTSVATSFGAVICGGAATVVGPIAQCQGGSNEAVLGQVALTCLGLLSLGWTALGRA